MRISEKIPNKQYNLAASNSLPVRIAGHQRRVMYERFIIGTGISEQDRMLDVGVTADRFYESSNYLEACTLISQPVQQMLRFLQNSALEFDTSGLAA